MSRRNKLAKFAELLAFPHVYENYDPENPKLVGLHGKEIDLKGKWNELHFQRDRPITLELACGRGEYTLQLARKYPERHFVGVDIKGARIWKGARIALEEELSNVAFLRTRIEQIALFFAPGEVQEIWITFPDPFPNRGKTNRRLPGPRFLKEYEKILAPGGFVHLKTDDTGLYEYTLEALPESPAFQLVYHDDDIYGKALPMEELTFKTYYEDLHLREGKKIKYVRLVKTGSVKKPPTFLDTKQK